MADRAVARTNVTSIASDVDPMFSDTRIQMIRDQVARGAPDDVFAAMIDIAKARRLDPLAKQIICAKFGNAWTWIVTIDGYRSIADQTGTFAGIDPPVFEWYTEPQYTSANRQIPYSATVTVYKMVGGQRVPFSATVLWEEYNGASGNWPKMPAHMLAKVAETHALRKAFPSVLGGMPSEEEPGDAYIEVDGREVNEATGEIRPQPAPALPRPSRSGPPAPTKARASAESGDTRKLKQTIDSIYGFGKGLGFEPPQMDRLVFELTNSAPMPLLNIAMAHLEEAFRYMRNEAQKDRGALIAYIHDLNAGTTSDGDVIDAEAVEVL